MSDFYKKTTGNLNFYGSSSSASEPDMREELINTFDGSFPEIAKAQNGLLRRARRDSDGKPIPCECVDPLTCEPDKDRFCPICYGEAHLWDEEDIQFYKVLEGGDSSNAIRDKLTEPGLINVPLVVFYIRYDAEITKDDKLVELVLNQDGTKKTPLKRKRIFRVSTAWDYRSDLGKLEYWKVFTHHELVKYLNAPKYGDV